MLEISNSQPVKALRATERYILNNTPQSIKETATVLYRIFICALYLRAVGAAARFAANGLHLGGRALSATGRGMQSVPLFVLSSGKTVIFSVCRAAKAHPAIAVTAVAITVLGLTVTKKKRDPHHSGSEAI